MPIDWGNIREQFEKDMKANLSGLPDHRDVLPELFEFRSTISHEIPETSPKGLFHL